MKVITTDGLLSLSQRYGRLDQRKYTYFNIKQHERIGFLLSESCVLVLFIINHKGADIFFHFISSSPTLYFVLKKGHKLSKCSKSSVIKWTLETLGIHAHVFALSSYLEK